MQFHIFPEKIYTEKSKFRMFTEFFGMVIYYRVSVGITVDAPVTALSNKTNDIQCFKDI